MPASAPITTDDTQPGPGTNLDQLAQNLAKAHTVTTRTKQRAHLSARLRNSQALIQRAYLAFRGVAAKEFDYPRAREWMLDNYHELEQTFHQIDQDLPRAFHEQLPKLDQTSLQGFPRVFAIAWEVVNANQVRLDLDEISAFMIRYQDIQPLTIGELWSFPTMLRIAIVERLSGALAEIMREESAAQGMPLPGVRPGSGEVVETVVANCITALRLLGVADWNRFFEQISRVERILMNDPVNMYAKMDFATRNDYRKVIEELGRNSSLNEELVAQTAIAFANNAFEKSPAAEGNFDRKCHVGYYLVDSGRPILERNIHYRAGLNAIATRWSLAHPTFVYLGSILIIAFVVILLLFTYAFRAGATPVDMLIVGLLGTEFGLELAVNLTNQTVTNSFRPRSLPRMDFSKGIPPGYRTMIVIPTLLADLEEIGAVLQQLELHHLSNPDTELCFALLTDFVDAPAQHMPEDEQLLSTAKAAVRNLNEKYAGTKPFYLFHRERDWNQSEGVWMGWERKRGKLAELNQLLLNTGLTSYTTQVGDLSLLPSIRYVITLDADTSLPHSSAARLIATMAHPLNRAVFDPDGRTVSAGYTVLQPRVKINPASANRSWFSQIFSGDTGYDLYTLAVSDVYQDLFGEGSYVGKGIYDIQAFEKSLAGQVRDNTLLSHDLFEGLYGRAALVTDIILYEDYPAHYLISASRRSRWIRGDWQLLPWLFPIVRTEKGHAPNRLSLIDRWKVFDNLRRSLLGPTYLVTLIAGWLILPGSPLFWTLLVLLTPLVPTLGQLAIDLFRSKGNLSAQRMLQPARQFVLRWMLAFIFLSHEAFQALDAISTTLVRLTFNRKNLLQWTTAAHSARNLSSDDRAQIWQSMLLPVIFGFLAGLALLIWRPSEIFIAAPLLIGWILAPELVYRISQPFHHKPPPISKSETTELEKLARRTWAYFEEFAGPDDHWLPADHFQEFPRGDISRYTTPTNIGLFLLSTMSAYDLGYIGLIELSVRLQSTFDNIDRLEHYRGHLLNWYDTQTLIALPPRYVSTADSGNYAACLVALKQGCRALSDVPIVRAQRWQGLLAILRILKDVLSEIAKKAPDSETKFFEVELDRIGERISSVQDHPEEWTGELISLTGEGWDHMSKELIKILDQSPSDLDAETLGELRLYLDTLQHHLLSMQRNIDLLAPWLRRLEHIPGIFTEGTGPLVTAWQIFKRTIQSEFPSLAQAESYYGGLKKGVGLLQSELDRVSISPAQLAEAKSWCQSLDDDLGRGVATVGPLLTSYQDLADHANAAIEAIDFGFLYDEARGLFHIGYNLSSEKLDTSYYDLLASESRIASFVSIAKGDVPHTHWLHLGRPVARVGGKTTLLSWGGTMFEYLMPVLLMRNYEGTFLADSCQAAVAAQISHGQHNHIPWGVSESGYYAFDSSMNYQYHAFGVPELATRKDLPPDVVITPYASLLALPLQPRSVMTNFAELEGLQMMGTYGFYEALDYTKSRMPPGKQRAPVRSYMAHHQGMILLSTCNYLLDAIMVRRFHSDERIQSIELLLQEKPPTDANIQITRSIKGNDAKSPARAVSIRPWPVAIDGPLPQVHFLSQGQYSLMLTNSGAGYSQWQDIALTRWQADATLDNWGTWIYVQDRESGDLWSASAGPTGCPPEAQEVLFSPHKVEFRRWDHDISLHTAISVGPDDIEVRRITFLNDSDRPRKLKVVSYAEVVLASQATDQRHPAFNKLFIESEYLSGTNALMFKRRSSSPEGDPIFLVHGLVVDPDRPLTREYETDRAKFIGRGHTLRSPVALEKGAAPLTRTVGATLDPIMSMAQDIDLQPHGRAEVTYLTAAALSREQALATLSRYRTRQMINRSFDEAHSRSEREMTEMRLETFEVEHIEQLLSALIYPVDLLRAPPEVLGSNREGQTGLWPYGISGDYPILLVRIHDRDSTLILEALKAYIYWRNRHVKINLVILNNQVSGYALESINFIRRQLVLIGADGWLNQRDGIFVLRNDQITESARILLQTVAGVILDDNNGNLAEHAGRLGVRPVRLPAFSPTIPGVDPEPTPALLRPTDLLKDNGLGGFSPDGKEYVIFLQPGQATPHPWINVISNPEFGFLVSEAGCGFTWSQNSSENRLTPWRNDPQMDLPGESVYLRDEETGLVWSPTTMQAGDQTGRLIRHGAGYSNFENQSHGLHQSLRLFVSPDDPVKIIRIRLGNLWGRPRRITVTYYAEWVLGATRDRNQPHIIPEFEPERRTLLATNPFNGDFGGRVAFLAANKKPHGLTADRAEFLGRLGDYRAPAALQRIGLASTVRAGLDAGGGRKGVAGRAKTVGGYSDYNFGPHP